MQSKSPTNQDGYRRASASVELLSWINLCGAIKNSSREFGIAPIYRPCSMIDEMNVTCDVRLAQDDKRARNIFLSAVAYLRAF